jgi:intracellular sulfur oxidation DsrE/DsrF family protein
VFSRRQIIVLVASYFFISFGAIDAGNIAGAQTLRIDIPAKVEAANVVFNIDHLAFDGDMPIAIGHLFLLVNDYSEWGTKGQIIAVFHTDAGHVTLNDKAYNAARHVTTGNPYKQLVAELMERGVQIELCGATAKGHHWTNDDLLPGVKVNTDAMSRLAQLGTQGYVQITE